MDEHSPLHSTAHDGIGISPSLDAMLDAVKIPHKVPLVDRAVLKLSVLTVLLGVIATLASVLLMRLIGLFTNLAFYQRISFDVVSPAGNQLGLWVICVPIVGGLIVGFMARYGSKAIRGHGIPEAMEQVLINRSRIPARITVLKPLSAAIAIGTGGPFGAEGPIIATGGALGSLLGQLLSITAAERKVLLAAGAAAGMSATFGSPISAVLLAVELLLFEFRARSIIPVALASCTAAGLRGAIEGFDPVFAMPALQSPTFGALIGYVMIGALVGVLAVGVTRILYAIEDGFEKLPIHWMWWPALGAIAVGVVGYFEPRTLGVGYQNITDIISGKLAFGAVLALCTLKFVSWSISLGSGTSGGTLAPLLTIGGGVGAALGIIASHSLPMAQIDPKIAALIGMAAMFAGASHAFLASALFAFETTLQPAGLLPLLAGCTTAYLASCYLMRHSIMTEKIARRGVLMPSGYTVDVLEQLTVRDVASDTVITLQASDRLDAVRARILANVPDGNHQGFPVVNDSGQLVGVLTRRDLLQPTLVESTPLQELIRRPAWFIYADCTVRQAADNMVNHNVGRLPVMTREQPARLIGIITRSDILSAYRRRIEETHSKEVSIVKTMRMSRARKNKPDQSTKAPLA